jgi:hypothetical protein
MKAVNIFFLSILVSFSSLAQSTSIEPQVFKLHLSTNACPTADYTGSIFYNTDFNLLTYCTGANSSIFGAGDWIGISPIYRNTNVGIRRGTPLYELDINGTNRATNFYVTDKLGVGTTTPPTEKVEIVDRQLTISSTADATSWRQRYTDAADKFDIAEGGLSRLLMDNGGNMGIGSSSPTYKFYVSGDVNYNGNLREGGFGTMASTETTVQKMVTTTLSITNNLLVNANACVTWPSNTFPSGTNFANPPAAFLGNKISGNSNDDHVVMTIENVTTSGVMVRFCNNKATAIGLINVSYSIIAIGD